MGTAAATTHRVTIHKHAFGYKVDPGKLKIVRGDDRPVVRFTNLTDKDVVLEFPQELFGEDRTVALSPLRDSKDRVELTVAADEGDFEYAVFVTAADIEAEGTSRPRILVER